MFWSIHLCGDLWQQKLDVKIMAADSVVKHDLFFPWKCTSVSRFQQVHIKDVKSVLYVTYNISRMNLRIYIKLINVSF